MKELVFPSSLIKKSKKKKLTNLINIELACTWRPPQVCVHNSSALACHAHYAGFALEFKFSLARQIRDQHAALAEYRNFFGKWQLILLCWNLLDNEPNGNCLIKRKLSEGTKYRVCEVSNLNQITVVKSLVCNKLCKIYHSISDFILERILYASKQTITTDILEWNTKSLLISLWWVRDVGSSGHYNLLNIRNFFDSGDLERRRQDSISVFINKEK